jgi:hypothetical protein
MSHKQTKEKIEGLFGKSNECNIEIFGILKIIKVGESWKQIGWARGRYADKFQKMSFNKYIVHGLGAPSYRWFKNIGDVLKLKNGRELYIKYGHQNMVTYLRASPSERNAIIQERESKDLRSPFSVIKAKLFPSEKKKVKEEESVAWWRQEAMKYKKKYEVLKSQLATLSN